MINQMLAERADSAHTRSSQRKGAGEMIGALGAAHAGVDLLAATGPPDGDGTEGSGELGQHGQQRRRQAIGQCRRPAVGIGADAVDFNMTGNYRAILAFLQAKKEVGGLKHYGGGAFPIDLGPRRTR